MEDPTLRQLQYVVAVADHRHFGRAAAAVNVSQPALSAQVRRLETRLGVELFERSSRQVIVSAAGAEVIAQARGVLTSVSALMETAADHHGAIRGRLAVGVIPTAAFFVPPLVAMMRERWPDADIEVAEARTASMVAAIEAGDLDMGLLALPCDIGTLHAEPVLAEPLRLLVAADHPLADQAEPVDGRALRELPVLLMPEGHCLRDQVSEVCSAIGGVESADVSVDGVATLTQMVAAGLGATLLPASACQSQPAVAELELVDEPTRMVALAWRAADGRHRLLSGLVPAAAAAFSFVAEPGTTQVIRPLRPQDRGLAGQIGREQS
jgi:LysR family transcriptional regulator, hydrogen peroxide-inducible genes activator